jgi:hypothetical protein
VHPSFQSFPSVQEALCLVFRQSSLRSHKERFGFFFRTDPDQREI